MDNEQILRIALEQSARDLNCAPDDFLGSEPVFTSSAVGPQARRYYAAPIACNLASYGNNVVAAVQDEYRAIVAEYLTRQEWYQCFETPYLHWLDDRLAPFGQRSRYMAQYYLPDVNRLKPLVCPYRLELLSPADFAGLYLPQWSNALCEKRRQLDVLAVGAYDGEALVGLAGCSADCDTMWQIGVDVLPAYRRRGIASALTSRLALETFARGRVPFYCAAWSNLRSARNALRCGFAPAWVELTVKPSLSVI